MLGPLLTLSIGYAPAPDSLAPLKVALQEQLDHLATLHPSFAMNLGWTSAEGSFGLAAGRVSVPGQPSRAAAPTDRYLFGSGTKPLTATAVMRLMEQGALSLDDPVAKHVDAVLRSANGTSMVELFGEAAAGITVHHILTMQSGLPDFDTPSLDAAILEDGQAEWPPYGILRVAASQVVGGKLHFAPGSQVEYSSTNYVLAGLVLLAHAPQAEGDWKRLDLFGLVFPPTLRPKYAGVRFLNDEPLSSQATVPGTSHFIRGKNTTMWTQKGGVLGWTCGNMAASALDVATFYHDLLVARTILAPESVALMERFKMLSFGWAKGHIAYGLADGLGLMEEQPMTTSGHRYGPPDLASWGSYLGHGGDTYGFLSEQGIVGQLGNASFSVVFNDDGDYEFATNALACQLIQIAAKVLQHETIDLHCVV